MAAQQTANPASATPSQTATGKKAVSYTISELAAEFDITTRTIRFYEEKGLLKPTRQGQNRIYSAADRTRLKLILRGKRLGLSLEESRDIIEMYEPNHDNSKQLTTLINAIRDKRQQLKQQRRDIDSMMQDLDDAEERLLESLGNLDSESTSGDAP